MNLTSGTFAGLFHGRTDAYGLDTGKVVKSPLTVAHYEMHLAGEGPGIGVFPLTDDGRVRFAAIDLDEPNFDMGFRLAATVPGQAWVERTRSGNVHVWVFFDEAIEAWLVRGVLKSVLEAQGIPRTEIFPKQDNLDHAQYGNYINLPYHGHERPILWHPDVDPPPNIVGEGEWLPGPWIENVARHRTPASMWVRAGAALGVTVPQTAKQTAAFGDRATLHMCATRIYRERDTNPLREGSRDVVLFNFAKQLLNWREMTPAEARVMVGEVNASASPPLPEGEVNRIFRNASTRAYTSTGCDDPLMAGYIDPDCPIYRKALPR